jgi:para-nitrobenzyl esterase
MTLRPLLLAALAFTLPLHADPLKIKTAQGTVEGALTPDAKVRAFKGIPYAAPPVGNLRWAAPQPPAKYNGTLSAKDYGNHCAQANSFADMIFHDPGPSEDCLTLNIWTPADAKPGAKLPVMFWIHGGGYYAGGSSEARQDGQFLAHRNVIIVTINYRLGIFGFFVHPELTAESPHHASGDQGLLDQVQALQWTHDNIAAFGGDPANITIFGESAGSFSVSSLMASPLSKNLIAKGIGESGGALVSEALPAQTRAERETIDSAAAQTLLGTSSLAELRKIPTDKILQALTTTKTHPRFSPEVDGYFLPESVAAIYAAGHQAHVPLIAGWNADEVRAAIIMNPNKPTVATFTASAQKDYGDAAPDFLKLYATTTDAEAQTSAGDLISDRFIAYSTWRWIEAETKTGGAPVYRYLFAEPAPTDKYHPVAVGAFHSDDIEYVFGTLDSRPGATFTPADRTLTDQVQQYWTNFAKTGDPNSPTLPHWPVYKPTDYQVIRLDGTIAPTAAAPDTLRSRYLFLDTHPLKPLTQ